VTSLYELTSSMVQIHEALDTCASDPETGEVAEPPDLRAFLEGLEGDYAAKLDACGRVLQSLTTEAAGVQGEAERLLGRSKSLLANADRLKSAVLASMVATGTPRVHTALFDLRVQDGAQSVSVTDLASVPIDLRRAPAEPPPMLEWPVDKTEAAKRLKAGHEIPGLALVRGAPRLVIR